MRKLDTLDRWLEAYFYSKDAKDDRLDRALALLNEREQVLIEEMQLDLNNEEDEEELDRLIDLANEYRNDEAKFEALKAYYLKEDEAD